MRSTRRRVESRSSGAAPGRRPGVVHQRHHRFGRTTTKPPVLEAGPSGPAPASTHRNAPTATMRWKVADANERGWKARCVQDAHAVCRRRPGRARLHQTSPHQSRLRVGRPEDASSKRRQPRAADNAAARRRPKNATRSCFEHDCAPQPKTAASSARSGGNLPRRQPRADPHPSGRIHPAAPRVRAGHRRRRQGRHFMGGPARRCDSRAVRSVHQDG